MPQSARIIKIHYALVKSKFERFTIFLQTFDASLTTLKTKSRKVAA
jgi:hypothetical protein